MRIFRYLLRYWLPLATAITLICGVIYLTAQQSLRLGANEPQIQMAEDAARALADGQPVEAVVPSGRVDLAASLSPYLIVYDATGHQVASSAQINSAAPELPQGIFDYVRKNGEDRVTWQPASGVREAAVVVPIAGGEGGYVLAGRSLREVESRIDLLGALVATGWAATLGATLVLAVLLEMLPFTRSQ